jgi:hypothetical protein
MAGTRFLEIPEEDLVSLLTEETLVLTSVNYEERTRKLFDLMPLGTPSRFVVFVFRSRANNVGLLELLKEENLRHAVERLERSKTKYRRELVSFPSGFDRACLTRNAFGMIMKEACSRVIVDITGMPRRPILSLLEALYQVSEKLPNLELYLTYTSADRYAISTTPQETGLLQGVFTGKPVSELVEKAKVIRTVMVPSIHGTEARLLLEEVRDKEVKDLHLLVPLYGHDLLTSLNVLRKDSRLLKDVTAHNYRLSFTFSTLDAAHRLMETTNHWLDDHAHLGGTLCLIAPFNVKLLLVPSYCAYRNLTAKGVENVDLIWPSVFHYSSVYSLGQGKTTIWKASL